jgi:hypothetical protein
VEDTYPILRSPADGLENYPILRFRVDDPENDTTALCLIKRAYSEPLSCASAPQTTPALVTEYHTQRSKRRIRNIIAVLEPPRSGDRTFPSGDPVADSSAEERVNHTYPE